RQARFERMKKLGIIDENVELSPAPDRWADVEHKEWEARCMEVYAAQVEIMDAGIGKMVEALEKTGQLDNTLILFLQDNGGCAEDMGRDVHENRASATTIPARGPDRIETEVFPIHTRDGLPVRDGH